MHQEDVRAVQAVGRSLTRIGQAIVLISKHLRAGGRLFFVGAGTSGRLGILEAAECPPTFSTPPSLVQAVIAGGRGAVFRSREGAEDDRASARAAVRRRVRRDDVVVGITASGVTPFVDAALREAARSGARTILLTCQPRPSMTAELVIPVSVGPEVLTGSTRLKAGTATKLVLNMLTLGVMVRLGKTHGHLMVDVRPTSDKLRARAVGIIRTLTNCSESAARSALRAARGQVKVAVLMLRRPCTKATARRVLSRAQGSLRRALGNP